MDDTVVLELPKTGFRLDTWTSYSFYSNFLTPVDEWHVTLENAELPKRVLSALQAGGQFALSINGHIQGSGYLDDVVVGQSRDAGTSVLVEGRDGLAQMLDTNMDPRFKFAENQTLQQFILQCAAPFGWSQDAHITDNNAANQNVLTGQKRGIRTSIKGRYLKSVLRHRLKPYPQEGSLHFCSRIVERHGLKIWLSADGTQLVIGKPSFDQGSFMTLSRLDANPAANNVIHGSARTSLKSQPSIIIGQTRGGGGEFPKSRLTRYIQNPQVVADNSAIRSAYPDAQEVFVLDGNGNPLASSDFRLINAPRARAMFLEDDESKTPEELENFLRREMALKMRQGFTAHYTVDQHTQHGIPWAVDTMVQVDDDRTNLHEPLYVLARTFTKSRSDGTKTHLELIRPNTLSF
jgi:prophage tail gpP-like protein